jgi:AcrR family transcriptional regulator
MGKGSESREKILDMAEQVLRRHGPAKTNVVDVARALDMSHANVYRHFASKAALQDAVAERWLKYVSDPLEAIVTQDAPAAARLEKWLLALAAAKRRKVRDDPELFATYHAVAEAAHDVVAHHLKTLRRQVATIITDGVTRGEFKVADANAAAGAVLDATLRYHHPHHVREAGGADTTKALRAVIRVAIAGLQAGVI